MAKRHTEYHEYDHFNNIQVIGSRTLGKVFRASRKFFTNELMIHMEFILSYVFWNKMDDKDPDSVILQKVFTKEELQHQDNFKFGVTIALMFLDPTYDQVEIFCL